MGRWRSSKYKREHLPFTKKLAPIVSRSIRLFREKGLMESIWEWFGSSVKHKLTDLGKEMVLKKLKNTSGFETSFKDNKSLKANPRPGG